MPYCPYCGSEISEEDAFCQSCGAMLGNGSVPQAPKKGNRNTKIIAVIIVFVILASGVAGIVAVLTQEMLLGEDFTMTYKWKYKEETFTYEMKVKRADFNRMMDSPIDKSGSVSADRYIDEEGKVRFAVSDYVVTDSYIKKLASDLATMYKDRYGADPDNDTYVKFAMTFVRLCISYDYNEAAGSEHWRYPLETLGDKTGDCEDTSILLAAILDAKGIKAGVILAPSHAMCAVCEDQLTSAYDNKRHSDIAYEGYPSGVDYYLIETTVDDPWNIGEISDDMSVIYPHLYLGSADDYYFKA